MNVEPGNLAYVVVPTGFSRLLAGKFVAVGLHGHDDISPQINRAEPDIYGRRMWFCTFHNPFAYEGRTVLGAYLLDAWLRPLREAPGTDETLDWAPVPAVHKHEVALA